MTKKQIDTELISTDNFGIHKVNVGIYGVRLIIGYLGIFIAFIGMAMILPCFVAIFYPEEKIYLKDFLIPAGGSIIVGLLMYLFIIRGKKEKLRKGEDQVLLVSIWVISILISSIPFMTSMNMNFTQAYFESTSGLTTTGLTVINPDTTPKMVLMYRSVLQFLGGVGLILIITATISDKYGLKLYSSEGHNDKLLPNMAKSARLILTIYVTYIFAGTVLYSLFGMPVFDAINHSISAIATGGFSVRNASIGYYEYLGPVRYMGIQIVTMILMILGATNFLIHANLLRGKFKNVFKNSETTYTIFTILLFAPIFSISLYLSSGYDLQEAIKIGVFQMVSAYSTTGYQIIPSIAAMPTLLIGITVVLMAVGGATGSTSGGIKQYRMVSFFKGIYWEFKDRLGKGRYADTHFMTYAGKYVELTDKNRKENNDFILILILIAVVASLIITACGYTFGDAIFEVFSAFTSTGLSVGITSPQANPIVLWTLSLIMFLGRLEIYAVFISVFNAVGLVRTDLKTFFKSRKLKGKIIKI